MSNASHISNHSIQYGDVCIYYHFMAHFNKILCIICNSAKAVGSQNTKTVTQPHWGPPMRRTKLEELGLLQTLNWCNARYHSCRKEFLRITFVVSLQCENPPKSRIQKQKVHGDYPTIVIPFYPNRTLTLPRPTYFITLEVLEGIWREHHRVN